MKKLFYPLFIGILLLQSGCSDDYEDSSERPQIAFAGIVDAECLYLTGSDSTRASDEETDPTLFKITFDGDTEKVIFTDENGKSLDVEVGAFRRLSDNYIFTYLKYQYHPWLSLYYNYYLIIRRSDGAVFEMDPSFISNITYNLEYGSYDIEDMEVQTDYNGNLYIWDSSYYDPLFKIYIHANEMYATQINRDDMNIWLNSCWLVDRRGNVLIDGEYIRLVSGEFARYSSNGRCFYAWNDSEGFYYSTSTYTYETEKKLQTIDIAYCRPTSPTSVFETIKTLECDTSIGYIGTSWELVYTDKTVLFSPGYKYRVDIYDKDRIELHEMDTQTLPDGITFEYYGQKYPHTEKYLYGMSKSEIWRLNVETGEAEMLYKYDDEFVIKSMTVRNGIVTFKAFELRRGNDVVAEIYPDKTVKVLESVNGDKIIHFERLN